MSRKPILFYGDPLGFWDPLLYTVEKQYREPGRLVIVSDLELGMPLKKQFAQIFNAGWTVNYIVGNHDAGTCEQLNYLIRDHPPDNLHGDDVDLDGVRIGGVGGVSKGRISYPPDSPKHNSHAEWMHRHPNKRWGDGVPIHLRMAIFPDDVEILARKKADVLVCHEGRSNVWKSMGFHAMDDLAAAMRVQRFFMPILCRPRSDDIVSVAVDCAIVPTVGVPCREFPLVSLSAT